MNRERIAQRIARQSASREQVTRPGAVNINNVDQATFREDLGFNLTNKAYSAYQEEEGKFNKEYGDIITKNQEALTKIGGIDKQIAGYEAQAKAARTTTEREWQKAEKGFVDVYMVGRNHFKPGTIDSIKNLSDLKNIKETDIEPTILHKVRLPKDVVMGMHTDSFNKGDGTFTGNWQNGSYYVSDTPRGIDDSYGKELRQSLDDAYQQTKLKFYESVQPKVAGGNQTISAALKQLGSQKAQLVSYRQSIQGNLETANQQKTIRDSSKNKYKTAYEEGKEERQALFKA